MAPLGSRGSRPISLAGRFGILLLAVLFVATACRVAHGQAKPAAWKVLETSYLPSDTSFAILVRPAELAKAKYSQPVVAAFDQLLTAIKLGTSVANIDEFKFVILGSPNAMPGPPDLYMVIRGTKPIDWKTVFHAQGTATEEKIDGQILYHLRNDAFLLPDDRTVIFGSLSGAQRAMEQVAPNDRADWSESWEKAAKGPLAGMLHMRILEGQMAPGPDGKPSLSLAPLTENAKYAVLEGRPTDKGLELHATVTANSNKGAVTAAPVVARSLTNFASVILKETRLDGQDGERLAAQLSSLLASTRIVTQGKTMEIEALVTPKMLEVFAESAQLVGSR
jgi:hypothetical protein